ncbi:MAG TPA: amino acid adenylation domain-containing protein [Pyrinomonadaceae bacterium]|nr:amino acid adenylation domain-containing protein [Pyrinomonadaceae bacterium]
MAVENITGFRLSPQQKHLWLLQQVAPHLPPRAQCVCVIDGTLDGALLKRALQQVVAQHEILRTSFLCLPEMNIPVQVIDEDYSFSVVEHDLSALPADEIESRIELLYQGMRDRNGDSTRGMKLGVSLLTLSELKHILLFSLPTLCADQITLKNFVHAVSGQYAASLNGHKSAATPMQYLVASEWLNELLESEDAEAGRDYWRKKDFSTSLNLELPFGAGWSPDFGYAALESIIDCESTESIRAHAIRYETTVPTFLLACWQTLLWRLTGQSSITVATNFDGRTDEELKETLGLLAKYLPIQIQFEKEFRFSEVMALVHRAVEEAYAWQECFGWAEVTNSDGKSPLTPICFDFDELTNTYLAADVVFSIDRHEAFIDNFKIKLSCVAKKDRIITNFYFDASAFALADIRRLSDRFHTLLANAVRNPEEETGRLEILSLAERKQILLAFNRTTLDFGVEENLHELIEHQAARSGEAVAVVFEGEQLTYAELDQRANQLAHYLRAHNVSNDDIVGVLMDRSWEMVVALLGIQKAGAAYLPLDPSYPLERLGYMIDDAGLRFVISHGAVLATLTALLPDSPFLNTLLLDAEWAKVATQPTTATGVRPAPDNLSYVIYTSGSTGQPKGVMISHRAIRNHMLWMHERFPMRATDAMLQKTPFSFDASAWEFYAPLLAGARLVMARPGGHQDAQYLVEVMEREGVTRFQGVPTLLRMLVNAGGLERCTQLREVFSGGEVLGRELAEGLLRAHSEVKLYNFYGPTEVTIDATLQEVERDRVWAGEEVAIGQPLANMQAYVLDVEMQVVPLGMVGELYVGGTGLARGYLNRPALTAERFVQHPYGAEPGARLYRTGDMVRWRENGELVYVGRVDAQVKLRGFRVELGEIEATLINCPLVRECAVTVIEHGPGDKRLVAYVVGRDNDALDGNQLRSFLKDNLPDYMIPSVFLTLEKMPLLPNGKIDRRALPPIDPLQLNLDSNYLPASTPTEEILADIWSEVLDVARVNLNDNFFELGGHSLLATQVITRARETFGQELTLRSLFETPTLAGLARTIELAQRAGNVPEAPPRKRIPRDGPLLLSFAQQRLWFLQQLLPDSDRYNISGVVRLEGTLRVDLLERAFAEMVRRHEVFRTTFTFLEKQPVQIIGRPVAGTLLVVDFSHMPASERATETKRRAEAEAARPFDLEGDPLLRVQLLRLSAEEHALLVTMHHIISDGWSIGVFVREVAALYAAYVRGEESPLAELPIQYADYAHWQRAWLQGEVLDRQLAYWREELAGTPTVIGLPIDKPRPPVETYHGAVHPLNLSAELSGQLRQVSRRHGATLFMTLLTAYDLLLCRYAGQEQVLVGTPIANRNHLETEPLIGCFVNTLVLRGDLRGNPTFGELLRRVRETALGAYAHQDLPFEKLVEELQPERDMSRSPLFQVWIVQYTPVEALEVEGLRLTRVEGADQTVRFELSLGFQERGGMIIAEVEYNRDLYEAETIERMVESYERILRAVVADPEQRVWELELLSEAERQQIVEGWNETKREYSGAETLHQLFEAQAQRSENAVAVVYDGVEVSYGELNRRANQLAHYLRAQEVAVEDVVGVLMERSVEMVVALLGILKAGGAYLPLDPVYPEERLRYMVRDSGMRVVLTQGRLWRETQQEIEHVLLLDEEWEKVARESAEPVESGVGPEHLAYVIYTSGSTGTPKGAMNTHGGICNRLCWMQEAYQLEADDRVLQKTPFSFDVSVWEFFWPLLTASRLVLARPSGHLDNAYLIELIKMQQITTLHFVPSLLPAFLEEAQVQSCDSLRRVICSGEALSIGLQRRFFARLENCELHNLYGPTEAAVDVTYWQCQAADESRSVPIGKPIANLQTYVLDGRGQPVPVGVVGELHLGGVGLGRGYLGRPELTAERFIPNAFSGEAGARLYRTGDLARYLADGNLEFLGRLDHQVKVRGLRIELGEIEAVLSSHPEIGESVVLVQEDQQDEKRLVAYVVCENKPANSVLRSYLRERLPEYMVPQAFVSLPALPLTASGKVDRRALQPVKFEGEKGAPHVPPRNEVERIIADIWQNVLGVQRIGIHDNFFDLGGHSLLAIQIHREITAALQSELSVMEMFRYPTVDSLASFLTQGIEQANYGQVHDRVRKQLEAIDRQKQLRSRVATRE